MADCTNNYDDKITIVPKEETPVSTIVPKPEQPSYSVVVKPTAVYSKIAKPYSIEQNGLATEDCFAILNEDGSQLLMQLG